MANRNVYLKQNIVVEPLFNQWYAWPGLIPPVTAALYVANAHTKILQSFVSAPQVHAATLKNRAMLGGPFLDYDVSRSGDVKQLLTKTLKESQALLGFASAVKALDDLLATEATGYSLESLYAQVPDALKGYVELVYDLNNNPSIRFFEGLLYQSEYYNPGSQSIALAETDCDGRSFVFSTPRLRDDGRLYIDTPFNNSALDSLFRMKFLRRPIDWIEELLEIGNGDRGAFASLFTQEEPRIPARYENGDVRIRYMGHACILIESRDVAILTDPLISYKHAGGVDRYTYADLPEKIDYALITHGHQDHVVLETLFQLRHKIENVIVPKSTGRSRLDPSLKLLLQAVGFKSVREIEEMESIQIPGGSVVGLPFLGEHADLDIRTKLAYLVNLNGNSIMAVADSNNLEYRLYEHIREIVGGIDVLFIGMECDGAPMSWLYGPLLTRPITRKDDQSRRVSGSDCEKGLAMVDILQPEQVYVYAMGQEPWCTFLTSIQYTKDSRPIVESDKLVEALQQRGLTAERLYGLKEIHLPAAERVLPRLNKRPDIPGSILAECDTGRLRSLDHVGDQHRRH